MRPPFTAGLLIGCLWGTQSVYAGSFEFTPLRANLSQQTPTEVITVKNNGDAAVVVQLQLLKWAMDGDQDVYAGSDEVLATPPIFTLPAAASQVVRVGLTQPMDPAREQTYRLFFEEVPPPGKRQGVEMSYGHAFENNVRAEVGVRHSDKSLLPAQPTSRGTTPNEVTSLRGKLTVPVPYFPEASLFASGSGDAWRAEIRHEDGRLGELVEGEGAR